MAKKVTLIGVTFCSDCAIVIANGDFSGIENAEAHAMLMDENISQQGYHAIVGDEADYGFCMTACDGCGQVIATDQWFDGWLEPIN